MTTTYPLSIIIIPGETYRIYLRYFPNQVLPSEVNWFATQLEQIFQIILSESDVPVDKIVDQLATSPVQVVPAKINRTQLEPTEFEGPQNEIEFKLIQTWEKLLGQSPIGVTDDFFDLGGTSLQAVRLFSHIKEIFGESLSPILLLQHRTIRQLASKLQSGAQQSDWDSVVPLRASGNQIPIFCFHAGFGHVFFYNDFAQQIDEGYPVFAIQPQGLEHEEGHHRSIEEMSRFYLEEIKKVYPEGPYVLIGYCFSTAICAEIAHQMAQAGEELPLIFMIDSAPSPATINAPVQARPPSYRDIFQLIKTGQWDFFFKKVLVSLRLKTSQEVFKDGALNPLQQSLVDMYASYRWKGDLSNLVFIRSSEFSINPYKDFHLISWKHLSNDTMKVLEVKGKHDYLFEAPHVTHLANAINDYLNNR